MALSIWPWPLPSRKASLWVDATGWAAAKSKKEQWKIRDAWAMRNRAAIRSYNEAVAVRGRAHARLACSAAIAAMRVANSSREQHDRWLFYHRISAEPDSYGGWGWGTAAIADGVVSAEEVGWALWGTGPVPGSSWRFPAGWNKGGGRTYDPTWNGITRIPKTSQKKSRR
ncbi:hypothetical protein DFH07DRAFT_952649 [Mycena maculata]|uniref:Uncharacterized protein n=1 Tax=Mycena maculata TaxID=230809 RepID=A0AAD7JX56_9AGAR|nr:hypothetical protein DFH07DRAFT_952649 [Mycena maculata]